MIGLCKRPLSTPLVQRTIQKSFLQRQRVDLWLAHNKQCKSSDNTSKIVLSAKDVHQISQVYCHVYQIYSFVIFITVFQKIDNTFMYVHEVVVVIFKKIM